LTYTGDALVGTDAYSGALVRVAGENVGNYAINQGTLTAGTNYTITFTPGNLEITPATLTVTADNKARFFGAANPVFTVSYSGFKFGQTLATSGVSGVPAIGGPGPASIPLVSPVAGNPYSIIPSLGTLAASNYMFVFVNGTLTINPDPTVITLDNDTTGTNFDCVNNQYTATLTDTVTGAGIKDVLLKLTIGIQSTTAMTNDSGVATFTLGMNQPVGVVQEFVSLDPSYTWTDPNRVSPSATTPRNFTVSFSLDVGPGTDASTLYTGSRFYWTTSSTSSTATLTLTATVKDTGECVGNITKAKVSFDISANGTNWTAVSNGQNLPVGLVSPTDLSTGTSSIVSQYNIGNNQSQQLWVRVRVGGQYYLHNGDEFVVPVTISKPALARTMVAGGTLSNMGDSLASVAPYNMGNIFLANGMLGFGNGITSGAERFCSVDFGGQVTYNNSGTNPQGQLNLYIHSWNKPDGTQDGNRHTYFVKSNSITGMALVGNANGPRTASFTSKTNVSEVIGGTKVGLDGGGTMQFMFTEPGGTYQVSTGVGNNNATLTCPLTAVEGCASVVVFRSNGIGGGVWFSSAWGPVVSGGLPQTVEKRLKAGSGTTYIN
jgi:large repetitive protein